MTTHLPLAAGIDLDACVASYPRQWASLPGLVKIREDLARYDHLLRTTRPDLVIECGTWSGASARWFAQHVDPPYVLTIDNHDHHQAEFNHPRVHRLVNSWGSTAPVVVDTARAIAQGYDRVMVVLDSDHSPAHVLGEMAAYGPLVTPGCHLVIEDGICRYVPGTPVTDAGPLDAIEAWVEMGGANDSWVRDVVVEGMFPATHHLAGWWQRL